MSVTRRQLIQGGLALPLARAQDAVFRADVRMVEVYATVFDGRGKFVDGLTRDRFALVEDGRPVTIDAFEGSGSALSCAILLDTTGSMNKELPVVKNSISELIDAMQVSDSFALFAFSTSLEMLQDFTTDKKAAKNSVLRVRAAGSTALFDAISQAARAVAARKGRKSLVVFTDGQDNASVLTASAAIQRARRSGIPIYTIAEGAALKDRKLVRQLEEIANNTGGKSYEAVKASQIGDVFSDISADIQHTYLLAYRQPAGPAASWRKIQVDVRGVKNFKVRAKEGYYSD